MNHTILKYLNLMEIMENNYQILNPVMQTKRIFKKYAKHTQAFIRAGRSFR